MSKVIQMIEKDQKSQKMQVVSDIQKAEQLISNIIENVVQGNIEAPPVVIMMKMFDKILKNSITGIEDIALNQINKNDPYTFAGHVLEKRDGYTRYNYSKIPEWQKLKDQLKIVEDKYKKSFQGIESGNTMLTSDKKGWTDNNGETDLPFPEISITKESLVLKKK